MKHYLMIGAIVLFIAAVLALPTATDYNEAGKAGQLTLISNWCIFMSFICLCLSFITYGREKRRANPMPYDKEFYKVN